jgi:NAD(P)-dependent dehydrogenase (short-subunit alcohol dehydrogenase family)
MISLRRRQRVHARLTAPARALRVLVQRVLVAGASGYLGSHVVAELKRRGFWVRALVRDRGRGPRRACRRRDHLRRARAARRRTETLSIREIAATAFTALGRPARIHSLPLGLVRGAAGVTRLFSTHTADLIAFQAAVLTRDMVAPPTGRMTLLEHFRREVAVAV